MAGASKNIALLEHLQYGKVNLVETNGGAWVAINVALERQDSVAMIGDKLKHTKSMGRTLMNRRLFMLFSGGSMPALCISQSMRNMKPRN